MHFLAADWSYSPQYHCFAHFVPENSTVCGVCKAIRVTVHSPWLQSCENKNSVHFILSDLPSAALCCTDTKWNRILAEGLNLCCHNTDTPDTAEQEGLLLKKQLFFNSLQKKDIIFTGFIPYCIFDLVLFVPDI